VRGSDALGERSFDLERCAGGRLALQGDPDPECSDSVLESDQARAVAEVGAPDTIVADAES
jgi:hypothetical protein